MHVKEKVSLNESELLQLMRLWNAEYPEEISYGETEELAAYLSKVDPEQHYLVYDQDSICAWMILFQREEATWFAMIVGNDYQGKGLGRSLIQLAQSRSKELFGWVIDKDNFQKKDGIPYRSPIGFYLKNGFELCPDKRLESDKMSAVQIRWKEG